MKYYTLVNCKWIVYKVWLKPHQLKTDRNLNVHQSFKILLPYKLEAAMRIHSELHVDCHQFCNAARIWGWTEIVQVLEECEGITAFREHPLRYNPQCVCVIDYCCMSAATRRCGYRCDWHRCTFSKEQIPRSVDLLLRALRYSVWVE